LRTSYKWIWTGTVAFALLSGMTCASANDDEDWKAARNASCKELKEAYVNMLAAEKKVADEIKSSNNTTVGTNLLGAAAFAATGFFFFTWDDTSSAEENLADLRNDLKIIRTVAQEKKCELS
jgi:flagellar hook assembly protein FlgD